MAQNYNALTVPKLYQIEENMNDHSGYYVDGAVMITALTSSTDQVAALLEAAFAHIKLCLLAKQRGNAETASRESRSACGCLFSANEQYRKRFNANFIVSRVAEYEKERLCRAVAACYDAYYGYGQFMSVHWEHPTEF